jgi:phage repressor protein C with HTH and peptisase S24 domain
LLALSGDDGRPFMAKRDGIYVLRMDDSLMVKRLSFAPDGRLSVISDNKVYPSRHGLMRDQVHIVGQVVWTGRML